MTHATVIIVGGGPAGISAAIQLKRSNVDVLLFESKRLGGRIINAGCVENFLGFHHISGKELSTHFCDQVTRWNIPVIPEKVTRVEKQKSDFYVHTSSRVYTCDYLILATGTRPKTSNIPGMQDCIGKTVFYEIADMPSCTVKRTLTFKREAVIPAHAGIHADCVIGVDPRLRGDDKGVARHQDTEKHIGIIGAGDIAFDYALSLCETNTISILIRGNRISALPLLVERVKSQPNITLYFDHEPLHIQDKDTHCLLHFAQAHPPLTVDYLLLAIGSEPNPIADLQTLQSDRLFEIGDLKNGIYRQVGISMGDGLRTAMQISTAVHTHKYSMDSLRS